MTTQQRSQQTPPKPMPRPANLELTKPFWDGTKKHELVIPHCDQCDKFFWHPQEVCPRCLNARFSWHKVSGRGRVYGYTTIYQSGNPAFANDGPYVLACIQLDEGARMVGNLVEIDPKDWHTGEKVNTRVEAVFDDVSPEWTFVRWRPVK